MASGTATAAEAEEEEGAGVVEEGGHDETLTASPRERWRKTSSKVIVRAALAARVAANSSGASRI